MHCYLIGGADVLDATGEFRPGRANYEAALNVLKTNGVQVNKEWAGGHESRTVKFYAGDGRVDVTTTREVEVGE